jgi:DNA-binding response OmpR family regulator
MNALTNEFSNSGVDLDSRVDDQRELILIVEDNVDTVFLLKQILLKAGFNVISALNGADGIKKMSEFSPDLIILDIMMPEMDGWETFQYFRKMVDVPVIIISALEKKEDIVEGFRKGIDDYITKPFYNAEVVERIKAVLRRKPAQKEINHLVYPSSGLEIDFQNQEILYLGKRIRLTPREFAVFAIIAKQAPNLVGYSTIMQAVWGEDSDEARKRMKYLVYLIRKKLEKIAPGTEFLENIDRLGYRLSIEPNS